MRTKEETFELVSTEIENNRATHKHGRFYFQYFQSFIMTIAALTMPSHQDC